MNSFVSSFLSRTSVYAFGFLGVLLLSELMPKDDFGKFSLVQSILEFSLVIATLGAANFYARYGQDLLAKNIYREVLNTIIFGFPVAIGVVFFCLNKILELQNILIVLTTLFVHAVNLLLLSALKGSGVSLAINYEGGIRSFLLVILVSSNYLISGDSPSLLYVFAALFLSQVFIFLYLYCTIKPGQFRMETPGVLQQSKYLWSSICQFLVRKSDILVVGYLYSFETVADFKIAFLFSEAIIQFVQAYINTQSKILIGRNDISPDLIRVFRRSAIVGALMVLGSVSAFAAFSVLFDYGQGVKSWYFVLLFYFAFKSIFVFHENLFWLNSSPNKLGARATVELLFRLFLVLLVIVFGFEYFYVYFVLIAFEVFCYQWWCKKDFGCSVFVFFRKASKA